MSFRPNMVESTNLVPVAAPVLVPELCHTPQQCIAMYSGLTSEVKAPALAVLSEALIPVSADIRLSYEAAPLIWWRGHKLLGIALRNLLRSRGYGEEYFGIHNLDDIYVHLIEEALQLQ